jgi:hypothetical protein
MNVHAKSSALCSILLFTSPMNAGVYAVTADGTWDCKTDAGVSVGTVVIADMSYAFLKPGEKLWAHGQLKQVALADVDLPNFVVMSGALKDGIGVVAMTMRGPKGHIDDTSGELFLNLVIAEDNLVECAGRNAPAP